MFPFDVQHSALVETKILEELVVLVLSGLSVSGFKKMMGERAMQRYLALEEAWKSGLVAAKFEKKPPFAGNNKVKIKDFLSIDNNKGYNLWIPGVNFWHRMLAITLGKQKDLWEKEVMMIDGLVLKGDHSRKAAKLIKIKGVRLFKSIYTLMNGDGQVMSL
jgi:hypothetical protein